MCVCACVRVIAVEIPIKKIKRSLESTLELLSIAMLISEVIISARCLVYTCGHINIEKSY